MVLDPSNSNESRLLQQFQTVVSGEADDEAVRKPIALKAAFDAKAQDFDDLQNEIALSQGQLDISQINRIINEARTKDAMQLERDEKAKKEFSERLWRLLIDQLRKQIEALDEAIAGHRAYFQDRYGDDWAETLGRSILGDDLPERLPGESDAAYQARIEDAIFDEICHPDGTLKEEYRDHPDADRLEQWGKDRAMKRQAEADLENYPEHGSTREQFEYLAQAALGASEREADMISAQARKQGASIEVREAARIEANEAIDSAAEQKGDAALTESGFGMR